MWIQEVIEHLRAIADGKEVAVGLESLTKTGKNKDKEQITRL